MAGFLGPDMYHISLILGPKFRAIMALVCGLISGLSEALIRRCVRYENGPFLGHISGHNGRQLGPKSPQCGPLSPHFRPVQTKDDPYMVDIQTIDGTYQLWLLYGHCVVSILSVSGLYH